MSIVKSIDFAWLYPCNEMLTNVKITTAKDEPKYIPTAKTVGVMQNSKCDCPDKIKN